MKGLILILVNWFCLLCLQYQYTLLRKGPKRCKSVVLDHTWLTPPMHKCGLLIANFFELLFFHQIIYISFMYILYNKGCGFGQPPPRRSKTTLLHFFHFDPSLMINCSYRENDLSLQFIEWLHLYILLVY